jgi:hypothetical protein
MYVLYICTSHTYTHIHVEIGLCDTQLQVLSARIQTTDIYVNIHACIHAPTYPASMCRHSAGSGHTRARIYTWIHASTHTHTHTHAYIHIRIHHTFHMHRFAGIRLPHACIHYTHTYMHVYINTHTFHMHQFAGMRLPAARQILFQASLNVSTNVPCQPQTCEQSTCQPQTCEQCTYGSANASVYINIKHSYLYIKIYIYIKTRVGF